MLRLLQIVVSLMVVPMMCLGIMASLSGGGMNPAFQRIGQLLLTLAPLAGILGVAASFILQRMEQTLLAYIVLTVAILVWIGLLVWLQRETGFFF